MAYQNLPRFEPNYGNRYGFRQRVNAPAVGSANAAVPGSPSAPPAPVTTGSSTRPTADYHSGPSAESDGGSIDNASYRDAASQSLGYERGQQTPGGIVSGLAGFIPGGGLFGGYLGDKIDEATGFGGIPEHQRYGSSGTIGTEGGVFNASGREIDPVTGLALNSYGNRSNFLGGSYVQGIKDNPYSLSSYLSDPDNAYTSASFDRNNPYSAESQRGLQAQGFQQALQSGRGLLGGQDETGTGVTQADRDRVAQHIAVTDHGIQAHSAEAGSATNQAIQGLGYSGTGAAPAGSQFSSTGTFSSSHSSSDDGGDTDGTQTGSQTSHTGGSSGVSFADDAAVSDSGGGGGK